MIDELSPVVLQDTTMIERVAGLCCSLLLSQERMQPRLLRPTVLCANPGRECLPQSRAVRTRRGDLLTY